jgi:hypothetical protein
VGRRTLVRLSFLAALLSLGALHGARSGAVESGVTAFRSMLWGSRALDLMVQVGLTLAGALGIVALLPTRKERGE